MSPQEREELIKDLFAKHGHVPLVQLIRHLIIALDKTLPGSEHRSQTIDLLKVLTGQETISPNPSHWLDWLDNSGEEHTWEKLRTPAEAKQPLANILPRLTVSGDKKPKPAAELSTENPSESSQNPPSSPRLSVEIPDDHPPKSKTRARPLTREQQIWDEALRRNEAKRNRMSRQWAMVIFALIIAGLGYLGYEKRQVLDEVVQKTLSFQHDVVMESSIPPELLWGSYRPPRNPMDKNKFLPFLQQEGTLKNLGIDTWLKEATGLAQNNILQLIIQEQTFIDRSPQDYSSHLDLRSFPQGNLHWNIERTEADGRLRNFVQSQGISYEKNRIELNLKRACGSDGIAHRIIMGSQGVLAWSWRLRHQNQTIDGQVIRQTNPSRMNFLISLPNQIKISHSCPIDDSWVIFPAVWTPCLAAFSEYPVLHPISGLMNSLKVFENGLDLKVNGTTISLQDSQNQWQEQWLEIPQTNLNR